MVTSRLGCGWSIDQAFSLAPPPMHSGERNGKEMVVAGVRYSSMRKAAIAHGLDPRKVHKRLTKLSWTIDQAFNLVDVA